MDALMVKVRERQAHMGISDNKMAKRLGITSGYLSKLYSGQRHPSRKVFRAILNVLPALTDAVVIAMRDNGGKP